MRDGLVFAALDPGAVQLVLGLFGLSGFGGLFLAFRKFGPETNEIAVGSMEKSNKQLSDERDYWERQAKEGRAENEQLEARVDELEAELRGLRDA